MSTGHYDIVGGDSLNEDGTYEVERVWIHHCDYCGGDTYIPGFCSPCRRAMADEERGAW